MNKRTRSFRSQFAFFFGIVVFIFACSGHAQSPMGNYPTKPVKLIIPSPPGGGTDVLARLIATKLTEKWSQPVVVESRAGAGGNIAAEVVFKAAPDGYTLMLAHPAPLVINKTLYSKITYEPDQFAPISVVASVPNVLVTRVGGSIQNLQQLISTAKASPDKLNYASGAIGSPSSLTPDLFKYMTGVKIVGIPFQGSAPALMALLGSQVDLLFVELSTALPHIRSGKLTPIAVASEKRSTLLPDTPTLAETLPGFSAAVWFGIVGPPKLPSSIADMWSKAVAETLKLPEVAKQLAELSMEPVGSTPAELAQYMQEESKRWSVVIKISGSKVD
jgi:tripartite-type tricarboxylate transporter receptor subunit TctC